jgi:hypothetical protein
VQGDEKIGPVLTRIVNVIPTSEASDIILGKFWIDPLQKVIIRSEFTTRSNGTIVTGYSYGSYVSYGLPDQMVFFVDAKKFKMPKNATGNTENSDATKKETGTLNSTGKITVDLTGYLVNKGISDQIFNN